MPKCFTCSEEITFDKNIRSKTGKQIPLWPDLQSAHGHDEEGKAIRQPLPLATNPYQVQPSPSSTQRPFTPSSSSGQSQGGSFMDTKRLRVMTEDLQKQANLLDEKLEACYQLDKSNNTMLGELIQFFKINDPKSAKELYEVMQHTKQEALSKKEPEIKGWTSDTRTEPQEFPIEKTLKDDEDEGVIDDL